MNLTPQALLAAVGGTAAVAGLIVAAAGLIGTRHPARARPQGPVERRLRAAAAQQDGTGPLTVWANQRALLLAALTVGLLVWLFSSWPVG